jgi:uncharacterized OB-fold protein
VSLTPQKPGIPLPRPSPLSKPYWDAAREGRLLVQRCGDCGALIFIPQPACTACFGSHLEWVQSSGRGTVYSYTVVHRPQRPEFQVPYAVAIVELEEGWHTLSNLIGCEIQELRVGMPVEVVFHAMSEDVTLPLFRPAAPRRA